MPSDLGGHDLVPHGQRDVLSAVAELTAEGWRVLDDVPVPGQRRLRVEHVLVGPPGVFVVSVLVPTQRGGDKAAATAAQAAKGIGRLTELVRPADVHAVLCLATNAHVDGWRLQTIVCSASTMADLLSARRTVLEPDDVAAVAAELDRAIGPQGKQHRGGHRLGPAPRGSRRGDSSSS